MTQFKQSFSNNEKGMTLIEVLASIVILTIILTSLLTVFLQSTKTTKTSSNTIDATYVAQTEMERLYGLSRRYKFEEIKNELMKNENGNYSELATVDNFERYEDSFRIVIELDKDSLIRVIVKVYDSNQSSDTPLVQMENLLEEVDTND